MDLIYFSGFLGGTFSVYTLSVYTPLKSEGISSGYIPASLYFNLLGYSYAFGFLIHFSVIIISFANYGALSGYPLSLLFKIQDIFSSCDNGLSLFGEIYLLDLSGFMFNR